MLYYEYGHYATHEPRFITERDPYFRDVVAMYKDLDEQEFNEWWNEVLDDPTLLPSYQAYQMKVSLPSPNKNHLHKRPQRLMRPRRGTPEVYTMSIGNMDPISPFTNALLPSDLILDETYYEVTWSDVEQAWKPVYRPQPVNYLFQGKRGMGKSLTAAALGDQRAKLFFRYKNTYKGQPQRVLSNMWIKSVQDAGPIAFERVKKDGIEILHTIMPCDAELPYVMTAHRPIFTNNGLVIWDEVADITLSTRANAREVRDSTMILRQIRKQATEFIITTQYMGSLPTVIRQQIDIYCDLDYNKKADMVTVYCFDWDGQFTGSTRHKARGHMDMTNKDCDWAFEITHISRMFGKYDTDEIQGAAWQSARDRKRIRDAQNARHETKGYAIPTR